MAFTISFILVLALALLVIHPQVWRLATWALNLSIHSGQYDKGAIGLPQSSAYLSSLSNLVQTEPLIVIIPIVATIALCASSLLSKKQPPANKITWCTALALFAIQVISFLVIAKENGSHYLIPLFITTGLNFVFLFQACRSIGRSKIERTVGWITLVVLLALGGKRFIDKTPETYAQLRKQKVDLLRLYKHAKEITKNDVRVDYFFSDSPEFPLCYGDGFAGGAFGQLLAKMYPDALFFNVANGKFETFTAFVEPEEELQKYDHLYFLGSRPLFPKVDGLDPATFETIDQSGDHYLQKWTRKMSP